jgi:excinuclease ABC subunit C
MPSLILIDGGVGQLHAAVAALAEIGIQPGVPGEPALASIAKREEVLYVYGQEQEPVVLDRRSPVLHLVQMIRDESHRFAVTYHRKRREGSAHALASDCWNTSAACAPSDRPGPTR